MNTECAGTRKPAAERKAGRPDGAPAISRGRSYVARYGIGRCPDCGRWVACHKDGSVVLHTTGMRA